MKKERIERNLLFPSKQFRDRVRSAAQERGFRSEQAFILAACWNEMERGDSTEAMDGLEDRIVATLLSVAKEVQSLFTLVHTQVALTNCPGKAEICKNPPPGRSGGGNAEQSHSGAGPRKRQTVMTTTAMRYAGPAISRKARRNCFPQAWLKLLPGSGIYRMQQIAWAGQ